MDAQQIEKLKQIVEAASPGPWAWWTSNSTYRLTGADGKDGGVLYASQHRGYADVACSEPNRAFIEAFNPAVAGALLAEVERLRAELAAGAARQGGDTKHIESEAVSTMLWLYRRLPHCYGRPPNVEAPIVALAKSAGYKMSFLFDSFEERGAATTASDKAQHNG